MKRSVSAFGLPTDYTGIVAEAPPEVVYMLTGISPDTGPEAGGTLITLTGSGFTPATDVLGDGDISVGAFTIVDDETITFLSPAGAGAVFFKVIVPSEIPQAIGFTYEAAGWEPLDDVGLVSGLYLPGGYSTVGTPGVNEVGTWLDQSGNARHFVNGNGFGDTAPVAHASGYPIFGGSGTNGLVAAVSVNGLCTGNNGAIIAICEHTAALPVDAGSYLNPTVVSGSGATPHLNAADAGSRLGGYDGSNYVESLQAAFAEDVPALLAGKWDASGVYSSLAGGSWSAVTPYTGIDPLDVTNMGASTYIGAGYSLIYQWTGPIKAVAFYPNAADVDAAKLAQWQAWAVAQGLV